MLLAQKLTILSIIHLALQLALYDLRLYHHILIILIQFMMILFMSPAIECDIISLNIVWSWLHFFGSMRWLLIRLINKPNYLIDQGVGILNAYLYSFDLVNILSIFYILIDQI